MTLFRNASLHFALFYNYVLYIYKSFKNLTLRDFNPVFIRFWKLNQKIVKDYIKACMF